MYSGGYGYYDTLLADLRFGRQAKSSFFRLYNKHWQILGLDTAYDENGLRDPQAKWVVETLGANQQKTMLLTHHQFFSAYENSQDVGVVLRRKLRPVLAAGRIDAAVWGHEHRCLTYSSYENIRYPRLIGHGRRSRLYDPREKRRISRTSKLRGSTVHCARLRTMGLHGIRSTGL